MLSLWLRIFSWCYGIVVITRNFLYKKKVSSGVHYTNLPIISMGNLSLGGTGKTPLTIFLLYLFSKNRVVAVLSRGYKRSSKGFKVINESDTSLTAGDEPYLMYEKFKHSNSVVVAVCEDRAKGIAKVIAYRPDVSLILLDDAFQQLSIRPTINILLTTFDQPFFNDHLLPLGGLREPSVGATRADVILVTKSPKDLSTSQLFAIQSKINKYYTTLVKPPIFFTHIIYNEPVLMWGGIGNKLPHSILLVTGVANPIPLREYLATNGYQVMHLIFPDHHWFNDADIVKIAHAFLDLTDGEKAIVTTEKDSVRLAHNPSKDLLEKFPTFYIPIEIGFSQAEQVIFEQKIMDKLDVSSEEGSFLS